MERYGETGKNLVDAVIDFGGWLTHVSPACIRACVSLPPITMANVFKVSTLDTTRQCKNIRQSDTALFKSMQTVTSIWTWRIHSDRWKEHKDFRDSTQEARSRSTSFRDLQSSCPEKWLRDFIDKTLLYKYGPCIRLFNAGASSLLLTRTLCLPYILLQWFRLITCPVHRRSNTLGFFLGGGYRLS